MKYKKIFMLLILSLTFIPFAVKAVDVEESERTCNNQGIQNCGRLRMCAIKKDSNGNSYCGLSSYSEKTYKCASSTSKEECGACENHVWNESTSTCVATKSVSNKTTKVSCGQLTEIPKKIPDLTSMIVRILWIIVPVVLVIVGSIDLAKGVVAGKEDEIQKGRKIFIKRLITSMIIFSLIALTKLVVSIVAERNSESISSCIDCFISGKCDDPYVE